MPMCRVSRSVVSGSQTIFKPITNNSALLQTIFGCNTGTAASFKGEIVSIVPLKLYPGVIENLRPRRHRARHKCDVDIRMSLQSDLIRAVFIQRRPGHFILLPTFNFKLKPLVPAQDVSPCRCLAKRLSGNIIQHVIFNRQIQFANNNTSPVKHE